MGPIVGVPILGPKGEDGPNAPTLTLRNDQQRPHLPGDSRGGLEHRGESGVIAHGARRVRIRWKLETGRWIVREEGRAVAGPVPGPEAAELSIHLQCLRHRPRAHLSPLLTRDPASVSIAPTAAPAATEEVPFSNTRSLDLEPWSQCVPDELQLKRGVGTVPEAQVGQDLPAEQPYQFGQRHVVALHVSRQKAHRHLGGSALGSPHLRRHQLSVRAAYPKAEGAPASPAVVRVLGANSHVAAELPFLYHDSSSARAGWLALPLLAAHETPSSNVARINPASSASSPLHRSRASATARATSSDAPSLPVAIRDSVESGTPASRASSDWEA